MKNLSFRSGVAAAALLIAVGSASASEAATSVATLTVKKKRHASFALLCHQQLYWYGVACVAGDYRRWHVCGPGLSHEHVDLQWMSDHLQAQRYGRELQVGSYPA